MNGAHAIAVSASDNAGNAASKIGSFSISLSNKPGLTLSLNGTPTRNGSTLTVPMTMSNSNKTAYNVRLTVVSLTDSVTVGTVLPYTVSSSISSSSNRTFNVTFNNVTPRLVFYATWTATAQYPSVARPTCITSRC